MKVWHWFENPISEENRLVHLSPLDNNDNIFVVSIRTVNWGFPDTMLTTVSAMEYIGLVEFGVYSGYDKAWKYHLKSFRYNPKVNEDNNIFLAVLSRSATSYDEYNLIASGYIYLDQAGEIWEVRISGQVYTPETTFLYPLRDNTVDLRRTAIQGVNIYY